jgi:integrase
MIRRKKTKLGMSYGVRFWHRGTEIYHHIGGSWEGWTEERVEKERGYIIEQVERGEYVPQRPVAASPARVEEIPTFQVFASFLLDRKRRRVGDKRLADLEWRLRTAMEHFGPRRVDAIDIAVADDFVDAKLREREMIEHAAEAGQPLTDQYTDARTGRTHSRRRRGLSNGSINKVLAAVRMVLKEAKRRGWIDHNPLDDRDCFLPEKAPTRSFLQVAQVAALLDAARLLDREQRKLEWRDVRSIRGSDQAATELARRYGVSETLIRRVRRNEIWTTKRPREAKRLPVVATLVLAGLRVSETCRLKEHQVELAARRIRVPRVKTDASERVVPTVPRLHEILLADRADRDVSSGPAYPTRNGTPQHPDNVRARLLSSVRDRANELLVERGEPTIGHLTPHTLRRTFASILAEVGVSPRRAMYLLGHEDPTLTMRIYQQVLDMGGAAIEVFESVLGCSIEEAFTIYSGREVTGPKPDPASKLLHDSRAREAH